MNLDVGKDIRQNLAAIIQMLQERHALNNLAFAEVTGIHANRISKFRCADDTINPGVVELLAIAKAFGLDPGDFLNQVVAPKPMEVAKMLINSKLWCQPAQLSLSSAKQND